MHQFEVLGEILRREPRHVPPPIARREIVRAFVPPRQHAPAERAVGHGGDAQRAARGEQVRAGGALDVEREGGVFDPHGVDGVDGRGAAEGGGGAFREAEVAHFAGMDGRGHGGDDGFDGDFAVEAVAGGFSALFFHFVANGFWGGGRGSYEPIPEIDVVGLQPFQTLIDGISYVLRLIGKNARAVR